MTFLLSFVLAKESNKEKPRRKYASCAHAEACPHLRHANTRVTPQIFFTIFLSPISPSILPGQQ
jgi:hypothetical protein